METVVVTDVRLDADKFMLDGIDVTEAPVFTVSEVAKIFFGRTGYWIRWLETNKPESFLLDGVRVANSRTPKGSRIYTLGDVEQMTHAFAAGGHINGAQAANSLLVVQTIARIHGFLA